MRIIESKSHPIFVVEILFHEEKETVHAQHMILYAAHQPQEGVPKELMAQTEYLSASWQIVKDLHEVQVRGMQYELLVS